MRRGLGGQRLLETGTDAVGWLARRIRLRTVQKLLVVDPTHSGTSPRYFSEAVVVGRMKLIARKHRETWKRGRKEAQIGCDGC